VASFSQTGFEGQALQETGDDLINQGRRQQAEQKRLEAAEYLGPNLSQFQLDMVGQYDQFSQENSSNPKGFADRFDKMFAEQTSQLLNAAPSKEAAIHMQDRLNRLRGSYKSRSLTFEKQATRQNYVSKIDSTSTNLINSVQLDPSKYQDVQAQLDQMIGGLSTVGVQASTIDQQRARATKQLDVAFITSQIKSDDPTNILQDLLEGEYNHLDPGTLRGLMGSAVNSTALKIQAAGKAREELALKNMYSSGAALDPKNADHKKAANLAFDELLNSMKDEDGSLKKVSNEEVISNFSQFVRKGGGIVAPKLASNINANILNGTKENAELYSQMLVNLMQNPKTNHATQQLDEQALMEGTYLNRLRELGTPLDEAIQITREQLRAPRTDLVAQRRDQLRSDVILKSDEAREVVSDYFQGTLDFGRVENSDMAVEQFKRFYKFSYERSGDSDTAKDIALNKLNSLYTVSSINGGKELMANAPEKLFPGRADEFKQQVGTVLSEVYGAKPLGQHFFPNISSAPQLGISVGDKDLPVKIRSLPSTKNDLGYGLFYEDTTTDGTPITVPLLHPSTGLPVKVIYRPGDKQVTQEQVDSINDLRLNREQTNREKEAMSVLLKEKAPEESKEGGAIWNIIKGIFN